MKLEDHLEERARDVQNLMNWWVTHRVIFIPLVQELEAFGADARVTYSGIDISMTGGKAEINGLFRIFRKHGYAPMHRPKEKDSYFSAFFYPEVGDHPAIWLSFSSSVCKRVQVGTKMEEVPVYGVQCAETLEVEDNG